MRRKRVFTYVTHHHSLLLLRHTDFPDVPLQVPGGTIESGETPDTAALREATEETGLLGLKLAAHLGTRSVSLSAARQHEVVDGWFYHLQCNTTTAPVWSHIEQDPCDGGEPVKLEVFWAPIIDLPPLAAADELMLPALRNS